MTRSNITTQSEEEGGFFFEAGLAAAEHHRRAQEQADRFVQKAQARVSTDGRLRTLHWVWRPWKKVDERRKSTVPPRSGRP